MSDDMVMVRIDYRGEFQEEVVGARLLAPNLAELTGFCEHVSLMPGDLVLIDSEGIALEVAAPVNEYMVSVLFRVDVSEEDQERAVALWSQSVHAMRPQTSVGNAFLRTASWAWVEDVVVNTPGVEAVRARRSPDDVVVLSKMVDRAISHMDG